ncbi:nuclear envelope integral membrane protein-like isoform X2 [Prorops nasuta]|uniref:nuclear envelope integral membrane protein-like isoform X2 n=1 Tax=Prorops nasuta TaxID=863751 RepID=UPI0034CFEAD3
MKNNLIILIASLVLSVLEQVLSERGPSPESLHFIEPGDDILNDKPGLKIYCHNAKSKYLIYTWKTLILNLKTNVDTYDLYEGLTVTEVMTKHEENNRIWSFNLFGTKKSKSMKINPFKDTCIGVYMHNYNQCSYVATLTQITFDLNKISAMAVGAVLFFSAPKLSNNSLFYYISGISLGVTTSILILIYFVSKLFPRGKMMYLMVATGWTMSFYIVQTLWDNAQLILIQYRDYVIGYMLITALISFIVCYRFGPVTNVRTKKIIQWFLQISGLFIIYFSSYFYEASCFLCVLVIILYNFPFVLYYKGRSYWKTIFPERRKLLTEDQYRKEGREETKKALKDLQEYCSSPECNPWKTVLRLKDPVRFAKFVEGDSHLSDDETIEHDFELTKLIEECEYTDDEDEDY